MKKKVIHLIPQDGLGGVEQAARSLKPSHDLNIQVAFIRGKTLQKSNLFKEISGPNVNLNSPLFYISGFKYLMAEKPDLLITSLWRSNLIGLLYISYRRLIFKDKVKFVVFLHADRFAHIVDRLITTATALLADQIWSDSIATATSLFKTSKLKKKTKVLSFLLKSEQLQPSNMSEKKDNFVFWGRLAKQKRLDRAITLFSKIKEKKRDALFYIYGPDCGELNNLKDLVKNLDLVDSVLFLGPKEPNVYPENAKNSKFFINTSSHEGMAIAVTEAMQLGLVPIVTPVGEIKNYCINDNNSIYYEDSAKDKILNIFSNKEIYSRLSNNAIDYWRNKTDYSTDFNNHCQNLINNVDKTN